MNRFSSLFVAATLAGCSGENPFQPTAETVPGPYTATKIVVIDSTGTVDWYARGSRITIYIEPNGTTSGTLFAPGAAEDGSDVTQDLTGTWVLEGNKVHFTMPVDTFMDEMEWSQPDFNRLSSDHTFSDERVIVMLGRFIT